MRSCEAHQDEVLDRFQAKVLHYDERGALLAGPFREVVEVMFPNEGLGALFHASQIQSGLDPPDIVLCKRRAARRDLVEILTGYCGVPSVEALGDSLEHE